MRLLLDQKKKKKRASEMSSVVVYTMGIQKINQSSNFPKILVFEESAIIKDL